MRMKSLKLWIAVATLVLTASCGTTGTVPITGRKQSLLVSDDQVLTLSYQEYNNYMKTAKPSTNAANTAMVKRVGQKLASAVVSYLNANGMGADVQQYQWEFNLVQDQNINAFCMPGGKIVVYEGLLPVTGDEQSLAIVLGHEIAHAVAKHAAERMSNSIRAEYGSQILGTVLSGTSTSTQNIGALAFGLGSQLGAAAYSRSQESEADKMGLIFAAMAGYNPQVAVSFWQRMAESTGNSYSLLSTHPSDATRIKNIKTWLPEAMKYYKGGVVSQTTVSASALAGKSSPKNNTRQKTVGTLHIGTKK